MLMLLNIPQETVFGIKTAKGDKYSPDEEELDDMDDFGETLTEFIEQYLAGKLEVSKVSGGLEVKSLAMVCRTKTQVSGGGSVYFVVCFNSEYKCPRKKVKFSNNQYGFLVLRTN